VNRLLCLVPLAVFICLSLSACSARSSDYLDKDEFKVSLISSVDAEEGKKSVLVRFSEVADGSGLEVTEFGERIELRVVRRTSKKVTPDFLLVEDSEEFGPGATIVHNAPSSPGLPVEYNILDGASDKVAYTWTHTAFNTEVGSESDPTDD